MDEIVPGFLPAGVSKTRITAGFGKQPTFSDGTKVTFHYRCSTWKDPDTVIDDTRTMTNPMELLLGKKFKVEIFEAMIKTMVVGEVAEFQVPTPFCVSYPVLSKTLRDSQKPHSHTTPHHCCGMMTQGVGYQDLDRLMEKPQPLIFTVELLTVEQLGEYTQEAWQLSNKEKLESVPILKDIGNEKFNKGDIQGARASYFEAISRLEHLILAEKPGSAEAVQLDEVKVPLLLNYSLCLMKEKMYYEAIEHITNAIRIEPENTKAFFRLAKCNRLVGNFEKAREDYIRAVELDPSLKKAVVDELKILGDEEKAKTAEDKKKFKNLFA